MEPGAAPDWELAEVSRARSAPLPPDEEEDDEEEEPGSFLFDSMMEEDRGLSWYKGEQKTEIWFFF